MILGKEYKPVDSKAVKTVDSSLLLKMYTTMNRIRIAEEMIADLVEKKEIICPCHLYIGQESVATAVCAALTKTDTVFSTHRSHGHYIAKGGNLKTMFAEIYGRATGCSKGHGGSMHLSDPEIGFPGSSAIVGGTIPLAVGAALTYSTLKQKNVSVTFFGDGATTEGGFYESINFAKVKNLPVVFLCENNFYSTHMELGEIRGNLDISKTAKALNIKSHRIYGANVIDVYNVAKKAVQEAKNGAGPVLIECLTYRWRGHVGPHDDVEKGIRSREEVEWWIDRCCIKELERVLLSEKILSKELNHNIITKINAEIDEALMFAKASPYPNKDKSRQLVFR